MAFRFILDDSRPLLDQGVGASPAAEADMLRADYGRASRLLLGIAATLALTVVLFLLGVFTAIFGHVSLSTSLIALPIAAVGAAAVWVLLALHRSGRRLSIALADRLTAAHADRSSFDDAVLARTFVWEPFVFWRIAAASLSLLFGVMGASIVFKPLDAGDPIELTSTITMVAVGVLLLVVGCGVFGGVFRVNRAHARRDPVQRRLLGG